MRCISKIYLDCVSYIKIENKAELVVYLICIELSHINYYLQCFGYISLIFMLFYIVLSLCLSFLNLKIDWCFVAAPGCTNTNCRDGSLPLVGRRWYTSRLCEASSTFSVAFISFLNIILWNSPNVFHVYAQLLPL